MKVTHSWYGRLADFDAWDSGKDALENLVKTGFVTNAESAAEDLWPDGVDDETLNDWLANLEYDFPEWFNDDWDEMLDVMHFINTMPHPWFITDGGTPAILEYSTDKDDARVFQIGVVGMGEDLDYDFSKSLEENLGMLKISLDRDYGIREKLPDCMEYVEDFPEWAVYYLIYDEDSSLSDEEMKEIDEWMDENGYAHLVSDGEEYNRDEFNKSPVFGKACATRVVVMEKKKEKSDEA